MESISVFDIFKIGVGPSSSHTLGPWKAALVFVGKLDRVQISLYGSLSKTGIGHATDKAIMLGLMGFNPSTVDIKQIGKIIQQVKETNCIKIQSREIHFEYEKDIIFEQTTHKLHPNTLRFTAFSNNKVIKQEIYTSVGGGFIENETTVDSNRNNVKLPYPINKGKDILYFTNKYSCNISDIVFKNEIFLRTGKEIDKEFELIINTIFDSIYEGCTTEGILPGGLNVVRRAKSISTKLLNGAEYSTKEEWIEAIRTIPKDFNSINKWVSCFALAVNEQNAVMGRIVTSPTNGAAGVIPAVLMYYFLFCDYKGRDSIKKFLLTAGEVGCLFKKRATISAAVGGCQAEIGVSSAMAAAGLTEALGGAPEQCLMAAEIAMEHHLGLTCDPIKGLVQVPCIERNAMGAIKAITACNLALDSDSNKAIVTLDAVIKTMWEVSTNMSTKYKETSEGGLAVQVSVINPSC